LWGEPDFDREGNIEGVPAAVMIFPLELACSVCGLKLSGDDELQAAGVGRSWELEDVDPADIDDGWNDWDYP
jgi:hypothetical protein